MVISLDLPHVFYPGSNQVENALALRIMLDTLIRLNQEFLRYHRVRPLYQSGVRYGRTQIWDTIPALYKRTYGDCKSLACALVAERLNEGRQAGAVHRWIHRCRFCEYPMVQGFCPAHGKGPNVEGATDYHILVVNEKGEFEDPSKVLGMNEYNTRLRA